MERVILELIVAANLSGAPLLSEIAERYPSLSLDDTYAPVEITPRDEERMRLGDQRKVVVVRGDIPPDAMADLEAEPDVVRIWSDGPLEAFDPGS